MDEIEEKIRETTIDDIIASSIEQMHKIIKVAHKSKILKGNYSNDLYKVAAYIKVANTVLMNKLSEEPQSMSEELEKLQRDLRTFRK